MFQDHRSSSPQTEVLLCPLSSWSYGNSCSASMPLSSAPAAPPHGQPRILLLVLSFLTLLSFRCKLFQACLLLSPQQCPHLPPSTCHKAARGRPDLQTNRTTDLRTLSGSPLPITMILHLFSNRTRSPFQSGFSGSLFYKTKQNRAVWKPGPLHLPTSHAFTSTGHERDLGIQLENLGL